MFFKKFNYKESKFGKDDTLSKLLGDSGIKTVNWRFSNGISNNSITKLLRALNSVINLCHYNDRYHYNMSGVFPIFPER